jgi:hypothetical protein
VVCADSLNYRCPARKAANTPYVSSNSAPPVASQREQIAGDSDSDSSGEITYDFVDVTCSSSRGTDATYHNKVGLKFIDEDDDRMFKIVSVCRENIPGRRVSFASLFFKYHDVDTPDSFEYTPCMEVINSSWCKWQETPSAAARGQRAARRDDELTDKRNASKRQKQHEDFEETRVTRSKR